MWWWIAVLVTALFFAVLVIPQPTRKYRIMAALAPFGGALFLLGHYKMRGMDPADALMMYSFAILSISLGLVGHVRKLSLRTLEAEREGRSADQGVWTAGALVQLFVALVVGMTAYFVLKP
ncbi:hypothetical protein ACH4E7_25290 [Kitasatospora sp. NPDC018058]|uniref:hypothetical protein n=1 Tax=Kitasatospora sp. NPDC018058 TaxID=3364025 RepID=UPI0037BFBE42